MEQKIILVAETGSDITPAAAEEQGIWLVPMHVTMGEECLDDGSFPSDEVCAYYDRTGKVPTTSASAPIDFETVFDEIHRRWPEKKILHLAYSAVTTCSYQNALLAAEERDYVVSVDTKQVSVGQCAAVMETARWLKEHPEADLEEAAEAAKEIAGRVKMCFIPQNLDYLRAGGRVSNAAAMVGNLLGLHPCIEIEDGKLLAKKKYRGKIDLVIPTLVRDFMEKNDIDPARLHFIWAPGLKDTSRAAAEKAAAEQGVRTFDWNKTGCVITSHGGAGAFGIVGFSRK